MNPSIQIIGLAVLIILSGFFASSELAFVVVNKIKIEVWARKNKYAARHSSYFINKPDEFFSTILISNNIVNIAFASISTVLLTRLFGFGNFTILIISTLVILIFGELLPKYFAREYPERTLRLTIVPIRWLNVLLKPFVKITSSIPQALTETGKLREENYVSFIDRGELEDLLNESAEAGHVGVDQQSILNRIIKLSETKVYEVMTPRTDIVGVEVGTPIKEVIQLFVSSGYSKLPVYEGNLDNIKGVIFAYDMFDRPTDLKSILRDIIYVPETKKAGEMLKEFLNKHISIAMVVDEFGGTAGIVTLEDVIEEMFGEIRDEYDEEDEVCKQVDENTYVISGKCEIDRINEEFQLNIPDGDYETIAGYVMSKAGKIPVRGEQLKIDDNKIIILHSTNTKINLIKIIKNQGVKQP